MEQTFRNLNVLYVAPVTRWAKMYWSWWTNELIAMLPEHWQTTVLQRNQRIRIEIDDNDFVVFAENGSRLGEFRREAGKAKLDIDFDVPVAPTEIRLVLPSDKVLIRQLELPLATEENLLEAMSFQMDMQTPFSVDQVYYDCHVRARDAKSQLLTVDLVVTPRWYLDELLDGLADNGISPDCVSVPDLDSAIPLPVDLLPTGRRRKNGIRLGRRRNLLLFTANLVIVAAVLATPLLQKRLAINALEPQVQQAIEAAKSGKELRQQVQLLADSSRYLRDKKKSELLVMRTFDEITRLLPENTWVSRLDIDTGEIQLQGQSSASATLIQLLEASPLLQNVRFRSPVTRIAATEEDRFHLSADLVQEQRR